MKRLSLSALASLILVACQSPAPQLPARLQSQAAKPVAATQPALSPALLKELEGFDEEGDPALEPVSRFDEELVRQTFGSSYVKAHSFYFRTADQGKSSVEAILAHDGHQRAAAWVKHWETLLGENALWPDQQSTSYRGPWPALEHGELKRSGGWFTFRSASTKAEEYYTQARQAWKRELAPDHPAQAEAWSWLARASHLLHDATVPFHTVSLARPSQLRFHTPFEQSCDSQFERYLPSRNYNPGGVWANGPYPADSSWGLYFAEGLSAREMVRQNADYARKFYKFVNESESAAKGNWERTRAVMIPLAAKSTAGLIVSFLQDVGAPSR